MSVEKDKSLQVRLEGHEKDVIEEMAQQYNVSTSEFVRMAVEHVIRVRPTLTYHRIASEQDEERLADKRIRKWLQVRLSESERETINRVALDYGVDSSKFVRVVLGYFKEYRPRLSLTPVGKVYAPAAVLA